MSWSVSATGHVPDVKTELDRQFSYPLHAEHGLPDAGERETVCRVRETIFQVLDTYDQTKSVCVEAHGHMGFSNWDLKEGTYQNVSVSIEERNLVHGT